MLVNKKSDFINNIRWMIRRDYDKVLEIEKWYGNDSPYGFESWDIDQLTAVFRRRDSIGIVYDDPDSDLISGYLIYRMRSSSSEILRFATDPMLRMNGVMSSIISKLKEKLSLQGRYKILCRVPEHNLPAQLFLSRHGFHGECRNDEIKFSHSILENDGV